jgi:hypothetical protein
MPYLVPFEPPCSPLSNDSTATQPLPLYIPPPSSIVCTVIFATFFYLFFWISLKLSYLPQYCHCHSLTGTIRTALISSIQRYHPHPTTATPHAAITFHCLHCHFFSLFSQFFCVFPKLSYLPQYCHYHVHTGTIRTALISSIQRYHPHPTTATPHAATTFHCLHCHFFHFFHTFFCGFPKLSYLPQYLN